MRSIDDLGYAATRECQREPEPVADILRKSISRPGAPALSAMLVRTAISLELTTAFPVMDFRYNKLCEIAER
jgi:hypothetical protein